MKHPLLALLALGPTHGYELKQAFQERFGAAWPQINAGQIYVTLQRLEKDGLITGREVQQPDRPNKTVYSLTPRGTAELQRWFDAPAPVPRLRDDFVTRVVLAQATAMADPGALIEQQRATYLRALRQLADVPTGGNHHLLAALLVEGASLHIEADLKWLDRCEDLLGKGESP